MAIKVFTILESIGVRIPVFLSDSCSSNSFTFSQSISGWVVQTVVVTTSVVSAELVVTVCSFVVVEVVGVVVNNSSVMVVVSTTRT